MPHLACGVDDGGVCVCFVQWRVAWVGELLRVVVVRLRACVAVLFSSPQEVALTTRTR